jgi:hypothetical protein
VKTRIAIFASIVAALVAGLTFAGEWVYLSIVGLDPTAFPLGEAIQALAPGASKAVGGLVLAIGTILLIAVAGAFAARWGQRADAADRGEAVASGRRAFLVGAGTVVGSVAAGFGGLWARAARGVGTGADGWQVPVGEIFVQQVPETHETWVAAWKGSRVERYGRLGRTEWPISDIVVGTGPLRGEKGTEIVKVALERGVNYVDTSPDYSEAGSEEAVGRAIQDHPRDQLFLATKFCTPIGHLPPGTPVARYKQVIEESLGRLGTDYVDLIHIHACDEVDRLLDPNVHTAFDELKAEGKARFLGFSSHTPRLEQVAQAAIDSGRFDVMMLAYHHGIWSNLDDIIARARREQDMGVVAMKTLKGARHRNLDGFQADADSYAQAALKWVHSNPDVSAAIISFYEMQHVDEYLYASGKTITPDDVAVLERYDRQIVGTYCAPHCGACLSACPEQVPIPDVLRHRMYFEDYRSEAQALEGYARLERDASACVGCAAPCTGSCPVGIPLKERLEGAHELLRGARRV